MPIPGICKLCGEAGDLIESHVELPKFVFKRLINPNVKNPHPVQVSREGVVQVSRQQKIPLLCSRCDSDRFGKLGENWIARHCLGENGRFMLRDLVLRAPSQGEGDTAVYYTASLPGLDAEAIKYFAASMIWRAQYAPGGKTLGAYDGQFREYLLGRAGFPLDATLMIAMRHRSNITKFSHGVVSVHDKQCWHHIFQIPGMHFTMIVGKDRPPLFRLACFAHSPSRPIIDSDLVDADNSDRLTHAVLSAARSGKRWRMTNDPAKPHHLQGRLASETL